MKKIGSLRRIAYVLLALFAGTAHAVEPGFYAGLSLGQSKYPIGEKINPANPIIAISIDERATTWALFAGYRVNAFLAVEAGYVELGDASVTRTLQPLLGLPGAEIQMDVALNVRGYNVAAVVGAPIADWELSAKLGLAAVDSVSRTDIRLPPSGGSTTLATFESAQKSNEYFAGIRVGYSFTDRVQAIAEFTRYFDVGSAAEGFLDLGDTDTLNLGLIFRF